MEYQLMTPNIPTKDLSVVEWVLANRGIMPQNIYHYLHTTDADIIEPSTIARIHDGVKMLWSHIANYDKIFIQVDSDADGFTSAAALINYLHHFAPAYTENYVSYRLHQGKEHGLIPDTIPDDVKLVIAPDSSSNDYQQHLELWNKGIDVLVIDHHEAAKVSEYACVINNQLCDYPTKSLSGVGMVYKFCSYMDELFGFNYADELLDLVAIGMIADMMDLRDYETHHLITKGLQNIINPFIRGMVDKQAYSLKNRITPIGIAFYIAPYINATIRVGTHDEKLLLFESMLNHLGYKEIPSTKRGCAGQLESRAEQAVRTCVNVKSRQTRARDASLDEIKTIIYNEDLLSHKILAIRLTSPVEKNLTGLIANQLMSEYQRPVLLLNQVITDGIITWEGSGRNYGHSKLTNLRSFLLETGLVMYAEGHASAFGVGITDNNFDAFIEKTDELLADMDFTPTYKVDFIFDGKALTFNPNEILEIAELDYIWGQNIDEPYVAIENVIVSTGNITLMSPDKKPTLKITLQNGLSLIKFGSSQEEYDQLCDLGDNGYYNLTVVGRCNENEWMGNITPQLFIEDYDIVNKGWYF